MTNSFAYLNGRIVPLSEAAISPLDIGLLRGYAVFDLLRTIGGAPFLLAAHLERLRASATELGLQVPASDAEIEATIIELLALNGHAEATVRMVLTGGVSPDSMSFDPTTPTFIILTHELHELPASAYEQGSRLITVEHVREFPHAKSTNYLTMLKHRPRALEAMATDLLYHDGEKVSEAASASVYFVRGGRILAPREGVLHGTIGAFVLDLARGDHEIEFCDISLDEALGADEVFLTSTTRGVLPIVRIDDGTIGDGRPGPITRDLMERFGSAAFG
jgi:branched-subunit amino acid aminotransferase/4-amino-4-deoxychorismate lyase